MTKFGLVALGLLVSSLSFGNQGRGGVSDSDSYLNDCLTDANISEIISGLKPPATNGDDEVELRKVQKNLGPAECGAAIKEKDISSQTTFVFFEGETLLTHQEALSVDRLLLQSYKSMDRAVWGLKNSVLRKRPFEELDGVLVCGPVNVQGTSFPSGHGAISELEALVLSDVFPDRAEIFRARAQMIAQHRVLLGVHYPSDVRAGIIVAQRTYDFLKSCKKYQDQVNSLSRP